MDANAVAGGLCAASEPAAPERPDPPDLTEQEQRRLAALHDFGILDTERERDFDDLTALAAQLCDTPIAAVSLIDASRQWFKSRVGDDATQTSREVSFCAHALGGPELLVVPDLTKDSRFTDYPQVTREHAPLRSYAGAPLVTAEGYVLGALCVLDVVPRRFNALQLGQLTALARQVVSQLELRRQAHRLAEEVASRTVAEAALRASQRLLDGVLAHTDVVVFAKDLDGRYLLANGAFSRLIGQADGTLVGRTVRELFPPQGAAMYERHDAQVAASGRHESFTERGVHADGSIHDYLSTRFPLRDDDGHVYAVAGLSTDITELSAERNARAESEQRWQALVEHSPVGVAVVAADGRFVYANPATLVLAGASTADELVGRPARDLVPDQLDARATAHALALLAGAPPLLRRRGVLRRLDGELVPVEVSVVPVTHLGQPALQVELRDMRAQDAAEQALLAVHEELEARQVFTDALLDSVEVGIVACDATGHLTVFNDVTKRWHGTELGMDRDRDMLTQAPDPEYFQLRDGEGRQLALDQLPLLRALSDGRVEDVEMLISPHGRPATRVLCSGRSLSTADGRPLGAVVAMTDITAARAQTRALKASEQRFRATFANDPAGLAIVSSAYRPLQVNAALCRLLRRSEADLLGLTDLLTLVSEDDRNAFLNLVGQAVADSGTTLSTERLLELADGRELWVHITVTGLPASDDEGSCLLVQIADITDRKSAELRLTHQALHDSLTELPNRLLLLDRTKRALARLARRPSDGLVAVLFCDLDGFKAVNDRHGHAAGDHLLVEVGRRLSGLLRPTDTVARLGGDEFVLLCDRLGTADEAVEIADRVAQLVAEPVAWGDAAISVTTSVGIAFGRPEVSAEELVRAADGAMYDAKRDARDRPGDLSR